MVTVLVHGAYQGGWIWSPVATRLSAAGHRVYAPSLDGCAERSAQARPGITTETQAEEIFLLRYEDLDQVVLVGTSSGGMVLRASPSSPESAFSASSSSTRSAPRRREDPRYRHRYCRDHR